MIKVKSQKTKSKSAFVIYLIINLLTMATLIKELLNHNFSNSLLIFVTLILLATPTFVERKFALNISPLMKIGIYLSLYGTSILGEIYDFYQKIAYWDIIFHTLSGFLLAAIGLSIALQAKISSHFMLLIAFTFSMTMGVTWEFFEYTTDKIMHHDHQNDTIIKNIASKKINPNSNETTYIKNIHETILYDENHQVLATIKGGYLDIGLNDTMSDLLVNALGAFIYLFFGYYYIKKSNKNNLKNKFLILPK